MVPDGEAKPFRCMVGHPIHAIYSCPTCYRTGSLAIDLCSFWPGNCTCVRTSCIRDPVRGQELISVFTICTYPLGGLVYLIASYFRKQPLETLHLISRSSVDFILYFFEDVFIHSLCASSVQGSCSGHRRFSPLCQDFQMQETSTVVARPMEACTNVVRMAMTSLRSRPSTTSGFSSTP